MTTTLIEGKTTTLNFALSLSFQAQITVGPPESEPPPEISQVPDQIIEDEEVTGFESVMEDRRPWKGKFHFRMGVENGYDDNVFSYSALNLIKFNPQLPKFQGLGAVNDTLIAVPLKFGYRIRRDLENQIRGTLKEIGRIFPRAVGRNFRLQVRRLDGARCRN